MRLKPRDTDIAPDATASARAEIRRLHRAPEPEVLKPLLKHAALDSESRRRVESRALGMPADPETADRLIAGCGGFGLTMGLHSRIARPHYLPRFCAERVTSTDTTGAGGYATLPSLEDVGL
jgi:hypothetical protein